MLSDGGPGHVSCECCYNELDSAGPDIVVTGWEIIDNDTDADREIVYKHLVYYPKHTLKDAVVSPLSAE